MHRIQITTPCLLKGLMHNNVNAGSERGGRAVSQQDRDPFVRQYHALPFGNIEYINSFKYFSLGLSLVRDMFCTMTW